MARDFHAGTAIYHDRHYLCMPSLSRDEVVSGATARCMDSMDQCVVMLGNAIEQQRYQQYTALFGVMFVAFLFGDLTNILCNLDPAAGSADSRQFNRFAY